MQLGTDGPLSNAKRGRGVSSCGLQTSWVTSLQIPWWLLDTAVHMLESKSACRSPPHRQSQDGLRRDQQVTSVRGACLLVIFCCSSSSLRRMTAVLLVAYRQ